MLTDLQDRTQLTRRTITSILTGSGRLDDFKRNPQQFIELSAVHCTAPDASAYCTVSTFLPRRSTPTTTPSMTIDCSRRSTRIGSKSGFSGNSQTTLPSCR